MLYAQTNETETQKANTLSESAFTFTEAQLGEDDDMSQNVTIINSASNVYAGQVGYLFSPVRFRYRAFNQKYNDVFINGTPMNDMESGQFRYSLVGGLNQQTRNVEFAQLQLPGRKHGCGPTPHLERRQPQLHPARHVYLRLGIQQPRMGHRRQPDLPLGQPRICGGNILQCAVVFLRCREEMEEWPFARSLHMGKPHRAFHPGRLYRRGLLAGQRLLLQPLLGLPERP